MEGAAEIAVLLSPSGQSPASGPALRTRKKGGWVGERKGGERRGRPGNQSLNLDTNLNRYCPSRSAALLRQQATSSASAPELGDTASAAFSLLFPIFYHLIFIPLPPLRLVSISLHCSQFLLWYLCFDLSAVHTSLSRLQRPFAFLFVRRQSLSF